MVTSLNPVGTRIDHFASSTPRDADAGHKRSTDRLDSGIGEEPCMETLLASSHGRAPRRVERLMRTILSIILGVYRLVYQRDPARL